MSIAIATGSLILWSKVRTSKVQKDWQKSLPGSLVERVGSIHLLRPTNYYGCISYDTIWYDMIKHHQGIGLTWITYSNFDSVGFHAWSHRFQLGFPPYHRGYARIRCQQVQPRQKRASEGSGGERKKWKVRRGLVRHGIWSKSTQMYLPNGLCWFFFRMNICKSMVKIPIFDHIWLHLARLKPGNHRCRNQGLDALRSTHSLQQSATARLRLGLLDLVGPIEVKLKSQAIGKAQWCLLLSFHATRKKKT